MRDQRAAEADLIAAQRREADVRAALAPHTDAFNEAYRRADELRCSVSPQRILLDWEPGRERVEQHRALRNALDIWEHWAEGKPLGADRIAGMLDILHSAPAAHLPDCRALAAATEAWAHTQGLDRTPRRTQVPPQRPTPILDIGIGL